jgi:hypothetical protein
MFFQSLCVGDGILICLLTRSQRLTCPKEKTEVTMSRLLPEWAMHAYQRIDFSAVENPVKIGDGSFGGTSKNLLPHMSVDLDSD